MHVLIHKIRLAAIFSSFLLQYHNTTTMSAAACAPGGGCDLPPAARVSLAVCVVYALTSMILALVRRSTSSFHARATTLVFREPAMLDGATFD